VTTNASDGTGAKAMLEIDLRDELDRRHGGDFHIKEIIGPSDGWAIIVLEVALERRSNDAWYKRKWKEAYVRVPLDIVPKLTDLLVQDWTDTRAQVRKLRSKSRVRPKLK
jgi:hypothetical protein